MADVILTVSNRMAAAIEETLGSLPERPEHAGIAELARMIAEQIDAGVQDGRALEVLHKLSPRLAGVLRELGATPASSGRRGGDDEPDPDDPAERELDELEQRRRTRADRAAVVDATPPGPDA